MATYSAPTTITTGQLVTASLMNTDWGGNITFLANPPACRIYHNTTQSLTDSVEATVSFNSESYDTNTMHDTATNNSRITFNTAGVYVVSYGAELAAANDYVGCYAFLRKNGATTLIPFYESGFAWTNATLSYGVGFTGVYKFAAADYVEIRMMQDNTANAARNILYTSADRAAILSATWIGIG